MLQGEGLTGQQVGLKDHLIGHCVNVIHIDVQFSVFKPLRERFGISDQGVLVVLEHWDVASHLLLGCGLVDGNVFPVIVIRSLILPLVGVHHDCALILHQVFISMLHDYHIISP